MPSISPFPGLDPWLEEHWGDVHTRFMVYASDQLNEQLPDDLQVRVEENLGIDFDGGSRTVRPDVADVEHPPGLSFTSATLTATAMVAEPVYVSLADEPDIERYIEIVDSRAGRVVTVIELLSPGNKTSEERRAEYRKKTRAFVAAGVNLVEIDLIRAGSHVLGIPEHRIPTYLAGQPLICVRRATRRGAELNGASLREPLPNFRIPLRPTDGDAVLQLQPLFNDIYRKGRYSSIDYGRPPVPRLSAADELWAAEVLRQKAS
jgi:hypothetical protein